MHKLSNYRGHASAWKIKLNSHDTRVLMYIWWNQLEVKTDRNIHKWSVLNAVITSGINIQYNDRHETVILQHDNTRSLVVLGNVEVFSSLFFYSGYYLLDQLVLSYQGVINGSIRRPHQKSICSFSAGLVSWSKN